MSEFINDAFSRENDTDSFSKNDIPDSIPTAADFLPGHIRHSSDGDTPREAKRLGSFRKWLKKKASSLDNDDKNKVSTSGGGHPPPMSPLTTVGPDITHVSFKSSMDESGISDVTKYTSFYSSSLDTASTISDSGMDVGGPIKRPWRYVHPFGHTKSIREALQRRQHDEEPVEYIKQVLMPSPIKQLVWMASVFFMLLIALAIILAAESSKDNEMT